MQIRGVKNFIFHNDFTVGEKRILFSSKSHYYFNNSIHKNGFKFANIPRVGRHQNGILKNTSEVTRQVQSSNFSTKQFVLKVVCLRFYRKILLALFTYNTPTLVRVTQL